MKRLKTKMWAMACLAVASMSLSSCLNGNNNSEEDWFGTPAERYQTFLTMRGNYAGKLYFPKGIDRDGKFESDSIVSHWRIINDSTMEIYNVPPQALTTFVSDAALKTAINASAPMTLKCKVLFTKPQYKMFFAGPKPTEQPILLSGASHKVKFFAQQFTNYSYGKRLDNGTVIAQLIFTGIQVDNDNNNKNEKDFPIILKGQRMP